MHISVSVEYQHISIAISHIDLCKNIYPQVDQWWCISLIPVLGGTGKQTSISTRPAWSTRARRGS